MILVSLSTWRWRGEKRRDKRGQRERERERERETEREGDCHLAICYGDVNRCSIVFTWQI
jgi:hypothetical protein